MTIADRLRTMLLPVFGFDSIDDVQPEHSLVQNLGADSLDFVEIVYLIEKEFGAKLETKEIIVGGSAMGIENIFAEGKLTKEGVAIIADRLTGGVSRWREGMTKMDIFQAITVADLARIVAVKAGGQE